MSLHVRTFLTCVVRRLHNVAGNPGAGVGEYQWIHAGFLFTVPKRGKVHGTEYEDLAHVGERVDELGLRLGDEAGELLIRACVSEL